MSRTTVVIRLAAAMVLFGASVAHAANIVADAYAWSENGGWINFAPTSGGGVTVGDSRISGYAWSENFGWIALAPLGAGVHNAAGLLSGFAWGENIGWINFATQSPVITSWLAGDVIFADGFD